MSIRLIIYSRLPIDECLKRFQEHIDQEQIRIFSISGFAGKKNLIGKIDGNKIRIQVRRFYRNPFAPLFYGEFVRKEQGTELQGGFRLHPFAKKFWFAWFVFLLLICFMGSCQYVIGKTEGESLVMLLSCSSLMALAGIGILKISAWLARNETEKIIEFLKKITESR